MSDNQMKQPEPIKCEIPVMGNKVMYSMMDIGTLMKLRDFIDRLIKWKAAGNPCLIGTFSFKITEETE
jgi:hypothetical protein